MTGADRSPAGGDWLAAWLRDLRYAARSLRRAPGFSFAVFLTLLVCIGPNLAVLSALYALVLKPLPFPDPGQLYTIMNVAEKSGGQVRQSSVPQCRDFQAHADLFAGFAVILHENLTLEEETAPARLENDWVTAGFFHVLGVQPVLGRFFTPAEETPGREQVLVLAQDFWESHFHADPGVIGRPVRAGGAVYTIIGVAPRSLAALSQGTCFFQPYAPDPRRLSPQARYVGDATLYARLKPGATIGAGLAQLATIERHFRADVAGPQLRAFLDAGGFRLRAEPLRTGGAIGEMKSLWLLQGGALFVLLIGCVNLMNLFLARLNARRAELAIRVALGAGRAALLRQMLTESVLLTGAAAIAGVGLAFGALHVFNSYLPSIIRTAPPVGLDPAIVGAVLVGAFGVALLVALLPLQLLWRTGLRVGDWRSASAGGGARSVSGLLIVVQVAVAMVLLVGASLLIRSLGKVLAVDPGFDAAHIVQGRIALPSRYGDTAVNLGVQQRILMAFEQIPGVEHVAEVSVFGLVTGLRAQPLVIRDQPLTAGESQPMIYVYPVSPGYFETMGIRLLAGRGFNDADDFDKDPVVVVDQMFADRFFPHRIAVGQEVTVGAGTLPDNYHWPRIIGVVNRLALTGLDTQERVPFVFIPMVGWPMGGFTMLVRSTRPTAEVLRDMRAKLRAIDPSLPLYVTGSLQEGLDSMLVSRRGITLLLGAFSGLALLLAGIGLYGVLAYDVSQRTREIGIRGAIGASRGQILGLILRQGLWRTGAGLAVGLVGAIFLARYLRSLLFEVTAADPASYAVVLLLIGGIALLASWLPARRAAKVDPIVALRAE